MPSHTNASALIGLFLDGDGAPWTYHAWKELTGVKHGLFPDDDDLLPKPWTRRDADDIASYFAQYKKVGGEDARIRFASSRAAVTAHPGRDLWRLWVNSSWSKWKIHTRISDILTANEINPIALYTQNPDLRNKPVSTSYIPLALDEIGSALFGEESLDHSGRIPFSVRNLTQHLVQRTWMNLTKQLSRSKQRLTALEAVARRAFEDLDHDKLTKAKIGTVIRTVARWRALAELFQDQSTLDLIEEVDEELMRLMNGLGATVKPKGIKRESSAKKLCEVASTSLNSLAKQEDMNDIIALYNDFFNGDSTSDNGPIINAEPNLSIPFGEPVNGADPGVEVEAGMQPDELAKNLGFVNGLPLLFNKCRHIGGLSAWDPQSASLFGKPESTAELVPIKLHWHQLAGVHAIIRKNFTPEPAPGQCAGMLLADEVGLGKTFQAATMIAVLSDIVWRQGHDVRLPPLIEQNPYLGELKELPHLPHLIVVPGTLLGQWEAELKLLLRPNSFDIFIYGSGKDAQEKFWDPSGPFHKSLHESNRIIITSHSAIQVDYGKLYKAKQRSGRGRLPWAPRPTTSNYERLVSKTIFGQRMLSTTLDEAHEFRNLGAKHSAALALVELAVLRLIATATPLQTSNQDSAAMGRLCGIPHFLSDEALIEEKLDIANLRKAKRETLEIQDDLPELVNAGDSDDEDEEVKPDERVENPLKLCQIEISRRHQEQFEGRIIRRTVKSLTWEKKPLLDLPECEIILGVVELTPREKDIITVLSDNVKDDVSTANGNKKISSKSFYIEYRMAVGYARETQDAIPHFNTLDEWEAVKSTKMDVAANIILHTLASDTAPPVTFVDGVPVFPPIPHREGSGLPSNKVALFQDFPSLGPVLRNLFDLYSIKYVYIDGQTAYQKRSKIVQAFNNDPEIRVLIFSSVGAVGLNLSRANTIIFLDQPWSAQDERQIRGRVHRQPQNRKVLSYHILAKDTADIILSDQARSKRDMMEAFLSREKGQGEVLPFALFTCR